MIEPLLVRAASAVVDQDVYLSVPYELHASLAEPWGLVAGFMARIRMLEPNDMLSELALGVGPRCGFGRRGLEGAFTAFRLGVAGTFKEDVGSGWRGAGVELLAEPQVGYAWASRPPGVFVALGFGLRTRLPLVESRGLGRMGGIARQLRVDQPLLSLTVGLGL
ncbi:MAG: hypothetical protein HY744_33750 [Deltaproteobacteria bacterium]|nr:hypothetical protein [Deltaproteobacteria bacterium]